MGMHITDELLQIFLGGQVLVDEHEQSKYSKLILRGEINGVAYNQVTRKLRVVFNWSARMNSGVWERSNIQDYEIHLHPTEIDYAGGCLTIQHRQGDIEFSTKSSDGNLDQKKILGETVLA